MTQPLPPDLSPPGPGDICVVATGGAAGLAISAGEFLIGNGWSRHDHVFVYLGYLTGAPDPRWTAGSGPGHYIAQAEPGGARAVNRGATMGELLRFYQPDGALWSTGCWDLTADQRGKIAANAVALLGTGYSFPDYLAIGLHRLHIPAPGLRGYIESTKHLICSQYADLCYDQAGVHLFDDKRWPGYVDPADIADLIASCHHG